DRSTGAGDLLWCGRSRCGHGIALLGGGCGDRGQPRGVERGERGERHLPQSSPRDEHDALVLGVRAVVRVLERDVHTETVVDAVQRQTKHVVTIGTARYAELGA